MNHSIPLSLVIGITALLIPVSLPAAGSTNQSDQEQEYIQVRKIALKDPKVQEAFERADERLDERILEIDPTLKPYMDKRSSKGASGHATTKASPTPVEKHTAASTKPANHSSSGTTHVVTKGETLSSIAAEYKVSVASLKAANNITDERKLRVGQKLVIPSATSSATAPAKDQDFWGRLKNSLD